MSLTLKSLFFARLIIQNCHQNHVMTTSQFFLFHPINFQHIFFYLSGTKLLTDCCVSFSSMQYSASVDHCLSLLPVSILFTSVGLFFLFLLFFQFLYRASHLHCNHCLSDVYHANFHQTM